MVENFVAFMSLEKLLKFTDVLDGIFPPHISREDLIGNVSNRVAEMYKNKPKSFFEKRRVNRMKKHSLKTEESSTKQVVQKYVAEYVDDMAPDFSPSFFFAFKNLAEHWSFKNLVQSIQFTEKPGLARQVRKTSKKEPVVVLANHVSNADHIPICFALNREGIQQPVIAAGDNLYNGISAQMLPKLNAYKLRRGEMKPGFSWFSNPIYKHAHSEFLRYIWDNNQVMMMYPEGGRARDGKLQNLQEGILKELRNYVNTGKKVHLALMGLSYTSVYEDSMLQQSSRYGKNISDDDLITQLKKMDENYKDFNDSTIHVHLQDMMTLTPERFKKEKFGDIVKEAMEGIGEGIIPTPTYIAADSILALKSKTFTEEELKSKYENICTSYGNYAGEGQLSEQVNREANIALDVFLKKRFITKEEGGYRVKDKHLLQQYANRIAHLK